MMVGCSSGRGVPAAAAAAATQRKASVSCKEQTIRDETPYERCHDKVVQQRDGTRDEVSLVKIATESPSSLDKGQ